MGIIHACGQGVNLGRLWTFSLRFRHARVLGCIHQNGETDMSIPQKTGDHQDYVAYLLRMWRDRGDEGAGALQEASLRASLQDPRSSELVGFASLEALFRFLRDRAGLVPLAEEIQEDG